MNRQTRWILDAIFKPFYMTTNNTQIEPPQAQIPEEIIFEKNAVKFMAAGFSIRGFKRTYRTLFKAILESMRDWSIEQTKDLAAQLESEKQKTAVALDALKKVEAVLSREANSYGPHAQRREDRREISEIIKNTLLIIK